MPRGLFITGTDTDVGKTYVTALIARQLAAQGHRVGVYKPVASGCETENGILVAEDAVQIWKAAGRPGTLEAVCPQRFAAPLAPHLAAKAEGKEVDAKLLRTGLDYWLAESDIVLIEGAGGLMSPICEEDYNSDLACDFGYPLIVVAANVLGTINATLQTLIAATAFDEGIEVAGIVLNSPKPTDNDPSTTSNLAELQARCVPPVLGEVPYQGELEQSADWWALGS